MNPGTGRGYDFRGVKGESEQSWRRLFSVSSEELYAVTDIERVRRNGGILWLWGALIAAIILPFAPPDRSPLGAAGWIVAVAILIGAVVYGLLLFRREGRPRFGPAAILAFGYVGIATTVLLNWLADAGDPYEELLLIGALYVAAGFPPRVMAIYMGAIGFGLFIPLLWDGDILVIEQVARLLIWSGLAIAVSMLLARQRLDREELRVRGDRALEQARADPLTGLGNRRAFDEAFAVAALRAARTERPVSVIVADVEAFKSINDEYGLIAGDRLLREVAAAIQGAMRTPDACFRWGGDEFVVLADVDRDDAVAFADRLVAEIAGSCTRPDGLPVRMHVGVAALEPDDGDPSEVLNAASRAMKPAPRRRA